MSMYRSYLQHEPETVFSRWLRAQAPTLSYHAGARNEIDYGYERIPLWHLPADQYRRCDWCGGRIRNLTSCPNCGAPER